MSNKISHSRLVCYNECGKKYFFKYIEKLYKDEVPTPLLFGIAIDESLNYALECKRDDIKINNDTLKDTFLKYISTYNGEDITNSQKVKYTNGDIDYYLMTDDDIKHFSQYDPDFENIISANQKDQNEYTKWFRSNFPLAFQYLGWKSLYNKGLLMLDTYRHEILPKLKRILDVQVHYVIPNGEGDELTIIMDFVAELHDGRVVVFDNKTTSKPYSDDSVRTSPQLATYLEYWDTTFAGYIALEKKIRKDKKLRWQMIIDEIPEEFSKEVFDRFSEGLYNMKNEVYEENTDSCFMWGRKCDYWDLCKKGIMDGLIKREKR